MAKCRVIKSVEGWKVGDEVEAFGERVTELVESGIVVVEVPDEEVKVEEVTVEPVEVVVEKPVKRGRKAVK